MHLNYNIGFERSLTSSRVPCESIKRYPVVARWRNDVDYVAAGIYCFQPYCVTGELDPPANPLICPQFCVRFNDLDNIGLTGRHYSGFIMLGIQVFNYPDKYVFFKDETDFMQKAAKTPRSNCVMSSAKLASVGITLTEVHAAVARDLARWQPSAR